RAREVGRKCLGSSSEVATAMLLYENACEKGHSVMDMVPDARQTGLYTASIPTAHQGPGRKMRPTCRARTQPCATMEGPGCAVARWCGGRRPGTRVTEVTLPGRDRPGG